MKREGTVHEQVFFLFILLKLLPLAKLEMMVHCAGTGIRGGSCILSHQSISVFCQFIHCTFNHVVFMALLFFPLSAVHKVSAGRLIVWMLNLNSNLCRWGSLGSFSLAAILFVPLGWGTVMPLSCCLSSEEQRAETETVEVTWFWILSLMSLFLLPANFRKYYMPTTCSTLLFHMMCDLSRNIWI